MPEELNTEDLKTGDEDFDKFVAEDKVEESSEGTEPSTPTEEVQKEEPKEAPKEPQTPDQETLELFKSIREEVGEKRFDGLMGAWQRDRTELSKLRESGQQTPKTDVEKDDALIEYLDTKLEARKTIREQAIQNAVRQEVDEARTIYPNYTEKQLLETANSLSSGSRTASIMTAAIHLAKLDEAVKAKGQLTAEESARKQKAGTIAGRSGVQTTAGVRPYDPEKDKDKSLDELVDEGMADYGIK